MSDADPTANSGIRLEHCRVYSVAYSVRGRNKEIISRMHDVCVVATDVADIVDQIRALVLGTEVTFRDGERDHYDVIEHIEIESAKLVGRLHGITETAFNLIKKCGKQA